MRACIVLPSLEPSGGVMVASAHARRLAADHGVEAELVVTAAADGLPAEHEGVLVRPLDAARGRPYDLAAATWWQTVAALWELDAARRVILLQSFEQRFYGVDAPFERLGAEAVLALPVDFVAFAPWLREMLLAVRPGARCRVVAPGIDKEVFSAAREVPREGPLRVLVEGQPSLPFKGVDAALAALAAVTEPVESTLVALDPAAAGDVPVDRVVGGLDAEGMAALYRDSDVLVKLSRVEGLGLAPVEGFHSGLPCIVTPYTGHDEYVEHGANGIVAGFDDPAAVAGWLDRLARDRDLLVELSVGARRTAAQWPDDAASTALLHQAVTEIVAGPAPAADSALLLRTLALYAELGRGRLGRLEHVEGALAGAQAHVVELSESREECSDMLDEARAELARIKGSRAYRTASAAKRAGRALVRR